MTRERAKTLASKWSAGCVCSLREGEAEEYHKMFYDLLCDKKDDKAEWISVKDRMPRLGERVLCTDGTTVFEQYRVEPSFVFGIWDRGGMKSMMQNVTHWMPIPEPPAKEGTI